MNNKMDTKEKLKADRKTLNAYYEAFKKTLKGKGYSDEEIHNTQDIIRFVKAIEQIDKKLENGED